MKKLVKIAVVLVVSAFMLASCNKYVCPAYAEAENNTEQQES